MINAIERIIDVVISRVSQIIPLFLAVGCTMGFFAAITLLAEHQVPQESHDIMMALVGSLGTAWVGVMNFYFGSSAGSQKKTEIMAKGQNGDKQP